MRTRIAVLAGLMLVHPLAAGCRGCAPRPAVTRFATRPDASPDACPPPVGPLPDAASTARDAAPIVPFADALAAATRAVFDTRDELASLEPRVDASVRRAFHGAARTALRCLAATEPAQCARLADAERRDCALDNAQVAARAHAARGWFATPAVLEACTAAGLTEAQCRHYGDAVETGDAASCAGLPAALGDCSAVASGDAAACARVPNAEHGCAARVHAFATLRAGGQGDDAAHDPRIGPLFAGLRGGAAACRAQFEQTVQGTDASAPR